MNDAPRRHAPGDLRTHRVWDAPVRVLHWLLAASLLGAGLTSQWGVAWHQPLGWVAAAAALLRVAWGLPWGTAAARARRRYALFAGFVRTPRATLAYAAQWRHGREPRFIGHNPLGGWMVLALLGSALGLAASGWLYTTDALFGDARVEAVHDVLAWALPALVGLHLAGVVLAGRRHRDRLVRAMVDGRKRPPDPGDID